MKKITIVIIILFLLIVVLGFVSFFLKKETITPFAAKTSPSLFVSPDTKELVVGESFKIQINFDSKQSPVTAVDITYLNFDKDVFQALEVEFGDIFSKYTKDIDNNNGRVTISGSVAEGSTYIGSGVFASVSFKALKETSSSKLTFDFKPNSSTDCNAWSPENKDILGGADGGNYIVKQVASSEPVTTTEQVPQNVPESSQPVLAEEETNSQTEISETPVAEDKNTQETIEEESSEEPKFALTIPTNLTKDPKPLDNKRQFFAPNSIKPWSLWFLYAIIPAFLSGFLVYLYLKKTGKRSVEKKEVFR